MKRTMLLLLVTAFISIHSYAQENKGKFTLGGRAMLGLSDSESENSERYSNSNSSYANIDIPFGYFVSNRFLVGITPGYSFRNYQSEANYNDTPQKRESKSNSFSIGPFVRYYTPVVNKLDLFFELNALYGFGDKKSKSTENEILQYETQGKTRAFSTNLLPGLNYKVSDWLYFDATFGRLTYSNSKYKPNEESEYDSERNDSDFRFYVNSISFGLTARLGK